MPRLTLQRKIFLALTAMLVAMLLVFMGFSRLGLQLGLGRYVAEIELSRMDWLAEQLLDQYERNGNWDALRGNNDLSRLRPPRDPGRPSEPSAPSAPRPQPMGMESPDAQQRPPPMGMPLPGGFEGLPRGPYEGPAGMLGQRLELVDAQGRHVAGTNRFTDTAARLPLRARDGTTAGYLRLHAPLQMDSVADRAFMAQYSRFAAWTGLIGLAMALALSWWMARRWLGPIETLTLGARDIADGHFAARVPVQGHDELAVLARAFNAMAERLDGIEASRREWIMDITHELRTPLAAMRAEIEALQDGIRTFDDKAALRLHRQVMRLTQLADDLRSSMDGQPASSIASFVPTHPLTLLSDAIQQARPRFTAQGLSILAPAIEQQAADGDHQPTILGDPRRLQQVFVNLLENTLRYTDAPGTLHITSGNVQLHGKPALRLTFDDGPPGVPAKDLARLFDRFYRGESSRSRALGGSGLGLSICQGIARAHQGSIEAAASPQGGLRLSLTLPLLESKP